MSLAISFRYLGVTISSDLSWNTHITTITARANRLLGFIRVVARGASTNAIFSLYKSLVLPILEYGVPAWHPTTLTQIKQVERVQRTATRIALKQMRGEMAYADRLKALNWFTLSSRRDYLLCSFSFKCLSGICNCSMLSGNIIVNPRHPDSLTFQHLTSRTQSLFCSPSRRLPRVWNSPPSSVKDAAILSPFPAFLFLLKSSILSVQ